MVVCAILLTEYSPYDVLDVPYTATEADVKRQYRRKALLIHPDKFKHEHVEEVSSPLQPFTLHGLSS